MSLKKELHELVHAGVISEETSNSISSYYESKENPSHNKLFVIFGILGALLVGLGIILILAHNWDELSRFSKTCLAFAPLILSQILCGYTLLKKQDRTAWRESSATFLTLSIGTSIALISQIYNMNGNFNTFLLTWMLLSLPLVYVMKSSFVSLLYIVGFTFYGMNTHYLTYPHEDSYTFWLLLLAILPHYYLIYQQNNRSNFVVLHHWFIPLALTFTLATFGHMNGILILVAYMNLFGIFLLVGSVLDEKIPNGKASGYTVLGLLATIGLLLASTFNDFWRELQYDHSIEKTVTSPELLATAITGVLAFGVFFWRKKNHVVPHFKSFEYVFIVFLFLYIIGLFSPMTTIFTNLLFLALSVSIIREGVQKNHLGIINFGLLMITALVLCRFFDTQLSFVFRGILFVAVGVGFFMTNFLMIKKRNG